FLLLVAERVDHRTHHADAEGEWCRRRRHLQLLIEDVVLHRGPAGAAIFLRPVRDVPALLVEDAPPLDHLVLGDVTALLQLLPRRRRHVVLEELTHLVAKRLFFLAEAEIHRILLVSKPSSPRRRGPIT